MGKENIPLPPGVVRPKKVGDFPAMFWSPDGVPKTFSSAGEVPADYTPFHPSNAPAKPAAPAPGKPTMTRKQVLQALKDGGVEFSDTADHESLYDLLLAHVKTALTDADIPFDASSTDAKALLALFPSS